MEDFDVVVVGAGYAGVACAKALAAQGKRVALVEARGQVGGRAWTLEFEQDEFGQKVKIDMGAGYYGPTQKRLAEVVRSLNEITVTDVAKWAGKDAFNRVEFAHKSENADKMNAEANDSMFGIVGLGHVGDDYWMLLMLLSIIKVTFLESLVNLQEPWKTPFAKALDGLTFREFFLEQGLHRDHSELWTLAPMGINSAYPENMSLLYFLWYHAANGGILATAQDFDGSPQNFCVSPGFGEMLAIWLSKNMTNIELFLNCPVTAIDCSGEDAVMVTLANGQEISAHDVVVATSVSQHSKIQFTPELDESRQLFASQRMGHAVKAILRYKETWWKPDAEGKYMLSWVTNSYDSVVEWGLDCSRPTENLFALMLFINPKHVREYGKHSEELKQEILKSFEVLAHDARARDVVDFLLVDWNTEEFIEGGPNIVMGVNCLSEIGRHGNVLNEPHGPHQNVWFAGAELSANFTGYLEGALRSGESVAARILKKPLPKYNDTNRKTAWAGVFIYGILFVLVSLLVGITWILRPFGITNPLTWIGKIFNVILKVISIIWKQLFVRVLKCIRDFFRFLVVDVIWRSVKWVIKSYTQISHNEFYALRLFFFETKKPLELQVSSHINLKAFSDEDDSGDVEDDDSVESQSVVVQVDNSSPPHVDHRIPIMKGIRRKKRGLVLSGGGAFGAYQLGVIEELVSRGRQWDVISGVSVGALNGSVLAMYGPDRVFEACSALSKIWLSIEGEEDIMKDWPGLGKIEGVASRKGLMRTTPLEAIVKSVLDANGLQKLRSSNAAFSAGVVCVETGDYFDIEKNNVNLDEFILASATMPFFMEAREIMGKTYMDGGVRRVVPFEPLLAGDCEEIDVICVHARQVGPWVPETFNSVGLAARTVDVMSNAIAQADLEMFRLKIRQREHSHVNLDVHSPSRFLGTDVLDFSPSNIRAYIERGRSDTVAKICKKVSIEDVANSLVCG